MQLSIFILFFLIQYNQLTGFYKHNAKCFTMQELLLAYLVILENYPIGTKRKPRIMILF